tara:strand:- start:1911 stop:2780 length:870 start_codon:yes stop_codon:yes gene_type:complete
MLQSILKSARPLNWIKNGFVLLPLVFSKTLFDIEILFQGLGVFFSFCFMSSSVYFFNDITDCENDQNHPQKRYRPIASGKLSHIIAWFCAFTLCCLSLIIGMAIDPLVALILLIYVVINLIYSLYIKNLFILDVMTIATGFVLRVYAGVVITQTEVSFWIIFTTYSLSMLLGFGKRRGELNVIIENSEIHRYVLKEYSKKFLDQVMIINSVCAVISYSFYASSHYAIGQYGSNKIIFTVPFVFYGVFRYLSLSGSNKFNEGPTNLFVKDQGLMICTIMWILFCIIFIYF